MAPSRPSELIEARLAALLGPNTARTAVRTFCQHATGAPPEQLTAADAPRVLAALRPTLRTLLGGAFAEQLLAELAREL